MGANDATGSRLLDMALEDGAPRSSLSGLFPANLPLPSLEDALMPLAATLPHLHPSSGRTVKIARKQAKRAQAKHPNISLDKCTAIVLYTMEEEYARETSLYYVLNLALRNQMRHVVRPWRDYVWLLLHALRELPPSTEVTVFRGCKTTPADLGLELTEGFEFTWSAFTSTATKQGVMQTFVGQSGPRTLMTIKMTEQVGRDVRDFSLYPSENEILFPPNMCFEIVDSFDAGNELIMVQCQQTETIDRILDLTSSATEAEEVGWLQQMFGAPSQRRIEAEAKKAAAEKAELDEAVKTGSISTLIALVKSGTEAGNGQPSSSELKSVVGKPEIERQVERTIQALKKCPYLDGKPSAYFSTYEMYIKYNTSEDVFTVEVYSGPERHAQCESELQVAQRLATLAAAGTNLASSVRSESVY